MLGKYYTNDSIRKYVVVFGSLFTDMEIKRDASDGSETQKIKVPLSYGPSDKLLARVNQQPNLETPFAITLPRMSFEIVDLIYDASRKQNSLGKLRTNTDVTFNPVPYNMVFNLYIVVKNTTDATRIVEQILPFFTPDFMVPMTVLSQLGVKEDIPISLGGVSFQDQYDGAVEDRRIQIWTLQFVMKAFIFGPVETKSIIKQVEVNMFNALSQVEKLEQIRIHGGQTANGEATSNTALMVPYDQVDPTKDWTFITEFLAS